MAFPQSDRLDVGWYGRHKTYAPTLSPFCYSIMDVICFFFSREYVFVDGELAEVELDKIIDWKWRANQYCGNAEECFDLKFNFGNARQEGRDQ